MTYFLDALVSQIYYMVVVMEIDHRMGVLNLVHEIGSESFQSFKISISKGVVEDDLVGVIVNEKSVMEVRWEVQRLSYFHLRLEEIVHELELSEQTSST